MSLEQPKVSIIFVIYFLKRDDKVNKWIRVKILIQKQYNQDISGSLNDNNS